MSVCVFAFMWCVSVSSCASVCVRVYPWIRPQPTSSTPSSLFLRTTEPLNENKARVEATTKSFISILKQQMKTHPKNLGSKRVSLNRRLKSVVNERVALSRVHVCYNGLPLRANDEWANEVIRAISICVTDPSGK